MATDSHSMPNHERALRGKRQPADDGEQSTPVSDVLDARLTADREEKLRRISGRGRLRYRDLLDRLGR